jgi:hypothetical protein
MKQIELERDRYRFASSKAHVLADKAWMRTVAMAGVWAAVAILFGRHVEHGLPWYIVAIVAFGPGAMLAYLIMALDDLGR